MGGDGRLARSAKEASPTDRRLDPEIAELLPKLPLRDSRILTPSIAREQLIALAQSRSNIPLIHGFFGMGNASAAAAEAGQRIRAAFKTMLKNGR